MERPTVTVDGNEAVSHVAYHASEIIAIYPITPASPMGEFADEWATRGEPNLWGAVPTVIEMQSEAGAAGALHGAIQTGALGTTFTASQGLLLMLPNLFKMAGELTPVVIHVAARSVATHALSIFGDHSDVMACRGTGVAMLASNSPQEAMDLALVAHAATLRSRIPFLHFFDGFRTSHEVAKIEPLTLDDQRALLDASAIQDHRSRALSPERPVVRGTAQNPDVFFQGREAANRWYAACPAIVQAEMERLAARTGRAYRLFDYVGAPDAERVLVMMGSGAETAEETVRHAVAGGQRVGLVKVRLYRPFSGRDFVAALPATTSAVAVLDRTKESGALGEPLYLDVVAALAEAAGEGSSARPSTVIGGRYGLSSKEFTPGMVKAVLEELAKPRPVNHFTVGIADDVTGTSLAFDRTFSTEDPDTIRAVFYGLGSDGTVGANKNSIKIIGEETPLFAQGYFVYDSKKAGATTVSHLRFGPRPIRSTYLIAGADFVACHQFGLLTRLDVLDVARPGALFLLNSPFGPDTVWDHLPAPVQRAIVDKRLRFFVIDADRVAAGAGMDRRINTVMQTCFFALSGVLPRDEAIAAIKRAIEKSYRKRGEAIVQQNHHAVDEALAHLHECVRRGSISGHAGHEARVPADAPAFVRDVTAPMLMGEGDRLPVSALPADGTFPSGTSRWEKRGLALEIPVWDESLCIQCGKCVLVCPHAAIRAKVYPPDRLSGAPAAFKSAPAMWKDLPHLRYTLQVAPDDCTGCTLCTSICPVTSKTAASHKAVDMRPAPPIREQERSSWAFFEQLHETDARSVSGGQVKRVQLLQPLFEFSGACAGCGETPYIKLLTQLFGDRAVIANATGCSSIYGGNLPTTPYTVDRSGRGPAWSNSLFEDNAEFGLGMRLGLDRQAGRARALVQRLSAAIGEPLATDLLRPGAPAAAAIDAQRTRVLHLRERLTAVDDPAARELAATADALVPRSVWIVGGDGWAYDIGFGGLDHVLASGQNVNLLVLDSEVYSNTGGQRSKSTPRGAVARFAAGGKETAKKDLALMAMTYGNVYVARVAMGGNDTQTVQAFEEAEAFDGPSLIIAFSPCIAHGYDLARGLDHQRLAVQSGYWPLFRYNPASVREGRNPLRLDSRPPTAPLKTYLASEGRFHDVVLEEDASHSGLLHAAEADAVHRWSLYERLAALPLTREPSS